MLSEAFPIGGLRGGVDPFDDPAQATGTEVEQFDVFRRVRDEIRQTFEAYVAGWRDALKATNPNAAMKPLS